MWRLLTSPCVSWPHTRAASPSEPPQGVPLSTPLSLRCYATQARQAALPSHALACMLGGPASTNRAKSTPFSPLPLITRQRSRGCPALCLTRALAVRRTLRAPPPRPAIHRGGWNAAHLIRLQDPLQGSVTRPRSETNTAGATAPPCDTPRAAVRAAHLIRLQDPRGALAQRAAPPHA